MLRSDAASETWLWSNI